MRELIEKHGWGVWELSAGTFVGACHDKSLVLEPGTPAVEPENILSGRRIIKEGMKISGVATMSACRKASL